MIEDIRSKVKEYASALGKFGKNSVGPAVLMWLLEFNFVRQGVSIAYAHARADWDGMRAAINECMRRIGWLVIATVVFCILTYACGKFSAWGFYIGDGFKIIYFVSLTALIVYSGIIAVVVAFALQIFTKMTTEKKVKKAEDTEEAKDPVKEIWRLFKHVLYWDCIFILLNFLAKPWQEGHFEPFVILVIAELALFILCEFTRKYFVRTGSAIVAIVTSMVAFVVILLIFLQGVDYTTKATDQMKVQAAEGVVDGGNFLFSSVGKIVKSLYRESQSRRTIPWPERLVDMNFNDGLDTVDVKAIEYVAADTTNRLQYLEKDGEKYPLGDFNGDGQVTLIDAELLQNYLDGKGPAPADLKVRQGFALRSSPTSTDEEKDENGQSHTQNSEPKQTEVELTLDTSKPFWNAYDLDIPAGCTVEFEAAGAFTWDNKVSVPRVGPEGAPWLPTKADRSHEFQLPNSRIVCLMAKIGKTTYPIGSGGQFYIKRGGRLQLAINERWSSAHNWSDNSGTINVRIRIT